MGSTEFGIPALEVLVDQGHELACIVSTPARKKGRGLTLEDSPVTEYARKRGLGPVLTPESLRDASLALELKNASADIFVVVAFRILPESIFTIPRLGTYNIHASLLPKYRGPAPIQRAIEAGEKETGVTIFRIDAGIDTGVIVLSKKASIGPEETSPQLNEHLSRLGAESLIEALPIVLSGTNAFIMQDASLACGAPKLTKAEGKIDWHLPAQVLFNRIRAFKPFPGCYSFLAGLRVNVEWGVPMPGGAGVPGTVSGIEKDGFDVVCGSGTLHVTRVKPEGKTIMDARDFVQGRRISIGTRFE
jgi:methionyl-tRNA formyltransferase